MVILVFPCFPMCFTFSLLLYINIGNELTYPPFIDKSILKKMLVGNSRNFPFCNFKIHFLIIWEIYIYIWLLYINIMGVLYPISTLPYLYISHNINPILAQHFCSAPRIGGRVATGHRYSRGSRRAPGAPWIHGHGHGLLGAEFPEEFVFNHGNMIWLAKLVYKSNNYQ